MPADPTLAELAGLAEETPTKAASASQNSSSAVAFDLSIFLTLGV